MLFKCAQLRKPLFYLKSKCISVKELSNLEKAWVTLLLADLFKIQLKDKSY